VFQVATKACELKFQTFCSYEFQHNFIVIKVKGGDLNGYQSKKKWQHKRKDLM
jgi:hypothetical protein